MNILIVSNMYPSSANPGYGVFVKNFSTSLSEIGVKFELSVIEGKGTNTLDKTMKYIKFSARTLFLILTRKHDIIYVHYASHSLLPLIPALPLIAWRKTHIVCNFHGEDLLPRKRLEKFICKIVQPIIRRSSLLVTPSQFFLSLCKNKFPLNRIITSPSGGIDRSIFKPTSNRVYDAGVLRLGFASRLEHGKGLDILLRATRYALDQNPPRLIKVTVVGEGTLASQLKALSLELNLVNHVEFIGALPQSELPKFYQSIDAFVFPTTLPESLGLVGIESLSCGTPAICSNIGGISEYISDSYNGYLFAPGDYKDLASKILLFERLPKVSLEELRNNATKSALAFDSNHVSQALYKTLSDL